MEQHNGTPTGQGRTEISEAKVILFALGDGLLGGGPGLIHGDVKGAAACGLLVMIVALVCIGFIDAFRDRG
jgi:hypothetical protein